MRLVLDLQGAQTESQFRGIGRQARTLAKAIIAHAGAHDILILLNSGLTTGLEALREEFQSLVPRGNIKAFDLPGDVYERDDANLWRMRAAELIREAFIADLRPDVVHISSLFEGVNDNAVTSIGLLQAPHATAVTLHDLIPLYDTAAYLGTEHAKRFFYRRLQSLKRADLLLAVSESARREAMEMLSIPGDRICVPLEAADESFVEADLPPETRAALRARYGLPERFILYVGAIEPRKNVSLIIDGFSRLSAALQDRHAIVFGGRLHPPERLQLRAAACRFGVDPNKIVFPGFIAEADLAAVYGMCDLFVFPSLHEGFGLPPLEAMACGAPVLSARNSSLPEVMGRDDLLFETSDAGELAAKMSRILADSGYAEAIRRWGIKQASRFSWDETGHRAIQALETLHERHRREGLTTVPFRRRLRLAFLSPLPNDQSGVADYGGDLLRELGRFYDIECIIHGTTVTDPWILSNFALRDVAYFKRHIESYDRIIYSVGNSSFHEHMFDLIESHPGVVILHDFFLSGIHDWLGNVGRRSKADFLRELYLTHGFPALRFIRKNGREAAARRYAANRIAFQETFGVIVHSRWSVREAETLYGPPVLGKVVQLPLLRPMLPRQARTAARRRLGIGPDDFLVCSFGFVSSTKLSDKLFDAWGQSTAGGTGSSVLVFVGENIGGEWGKTLDAAIAAQSGTVRAVISGYVDPARYEDYLVAADVAVQLRTNSRGETSRAVLDCMAAGLPVIFNSHGTAAELPDDIAVKIPDQFKIQELADAVDALFENAERRHSIGASGLAYIQQHHSPTKVGEQMRDAIEAFYASSAGARQQQMLQALREIHSYQILPTEQDLIRVADNLARGTSRIGLRQILFDVTLLAENDTHTGIERVVRSILWQLLQEPPPGFRLEPVRIDGHGLRYARGFMAARFDILADVMPDSPVDVDAGDVYITLEWAADRLPELVDWLQHFRQTGGKVVIGIHDLLPLIMPGKFPPHIGPVSERWFEAVLRVSDQLICVSRTVADDVLRFGNALYEGAGGIAVDYYHNAHDIKMSIPTRGLPAEAPALLAATKKRETFLMVATVEPRKGHLLVLQAFARLWSQGADVGLVIVGKKGWMVDAVEKLIAGSPEKDKRLFWFTNISDEFLERLYGSCSALIAASEGEGFGLPLVEAAAHQLPIIARDIPVFREVARQHAFFFDGSTPAELAAAVETWLALARRQAAPSSAGMPILTWKESTAQFLRAMLAEEHYGVIGDLHPKRDAAA